MIAIPISYAVIGAAIMLLPGVLALLARDSSVWKSLALACSIAAVVLAASAGVNPIARVAGVVVLWLISWLCAGRALTNYQSRLARERREADALRAVDRALQPPRRGWLRRRDRRP